MKGSASHLLEFLEGTRKRFVIPVYQRNYDWKKANCEQLFDDLVNLIKKDKQSHFFGSIVSYAASRDEIILIDGQQRITTISLILIAIINAIKKGTAKTDDDTLSERIEGTYIIDKYRPEERKVRLKPFRDDCNAFDRLIFNGEEDYIAESKVTINYNYFYDRIVNRRELTVDQLFEAIDKLIVIDIELEPQHGDDPQLIFESLNSTGLDLTEADKIRNYILMGLPSDTQEKFYDEYWNRIEKLCGTELDGFVRNYLTIVTGSIPNIRNIYAAFKEYTKNTEDIEIILQDMLKYAKAYQRIISCDLGSPRADSIARRLDMLDITVVHPFLMAYISFADDQQLPLTETEIVLQTIETLIFRRMACELPANILNKVFATLHPIVLKQKKETDSYSSVMIYLLENRRVTTLLPKDEEFLQGFTTRNIYAMRGKYREYIFERLENGSSKEVNDIVGNMEKNLLTIEHIMPQTLTPAWRLALGDNADTIYETWVHTIANLTLTGYNSNYSNRTFQEKKAMENGFEQSGLRLNQYIAKFDKWTLEELEERKKKLSELALSVWGYPSTAFVPEVKEDELIPLSVDNSTFTNRVINYCLFQQSKYTPASWADLLWIIVGQLFLINPEYLYQEAANSDNVWFTTEEEKYFRKIADKLYFAPGNGGTWGKIAQLKKLFRIYQIDEDELQFCLLNSGDDDME